MIDLLLCHPPHHRNIPGLTLPTLKAFLEHKGFSVVTIPSPSNNRDIIDAVNFYSPRFIGISSPFTFYGPATQKLIQTLKILTDVPIVVGGAHVTICPDDFKSADYICRGYGEDFLLKLLSGVDPTPGVHMDELPCIISKENIETLCNGVKAMRYLSSRGCVFNCNFCSNKLLSGGEVHYRSIENVIEDFRVFKKQKISGVVFNDETFTLNRKRTLDLCSQLIDNAINMKWWCQTRANLVDNELLYFMHEAGCMGISFGVESGDETILQQCDKAVKLYDVAVATDDCRSANILSYGGFIIGHPGDTLTSVKNSVEFSCHTQLDYAGFGLMMPFPGTRVREQAIQDGGIVCDDFSKYHAGEILYIPPGLKNIDLQKLLWWSCGKFMSSTTHRLWCNGIGYARKKGWRPKADFARRIYYGLSFQRTIQ